MNLELLLTPPIAFILYIPLILILTGLGKRMAGVSNPSDQKRTLYGSGEVAPTSFTAPGYRPFFLVALFFAILHLGILVLGAGSLNLPEALFLGGIILALVALILG